MQSPSLDAGDGCGELEIWKILNIVGYAKRRSTLRQGPARQADNAFRHRDKPAGRSTVERPAG